MKKPKEEVIMAEGQNVTLTCRVKGKPKPTVVWYKSNQLLVSDRFVVEDSGNLFIIVREASESKLFVKIVKKSVMISRNLSLKYCSYMANS